MEMVKLKMKTIYKTILSFIVFLLVIITSLGITYLFFDKVIQDDSDIVVTNSLSINYINGKNIDIADFGIINFSITNSGNEVVYYNINFLKIRGNGIYKLKYNNNIIIEGNLKSIDEISTEYISIDIGETKEYSLEIFNNDSNKNLKGIIDIRDKENKTLTFKDSILKNVVVAENPLTKIGSEVAIEDEGLIKSYDDLGVSYYFRGNVKNNYVLFADLYWRIVRINGDGTIRLVLDGVTDSLTTYYDNNSIEYLYKNSPMENYLLDWFNLYLNDYIDYIANTKFCNDIVRDDIYNYNSYTRIIINKIPTLNCLGTNVISNIGVLSVDEVIFAGADTSNINQNFYLYNPKISNVWYTMTAAKGNDKSINMFMVDKNGKIVTNINGNLYREVRPVINLIKNIEVIGDGTEDNPYIIVS